MRKKLKPPCLTCGKETPRASPIYCGNTCQQEYQSRIYIQRWLQGKETGRTEYGIVSKYVRNWILETKGRKCGKCGWKKKNQKTKRVPVEIDHIDGDWKNCNPLNLRVLCPNCHSLTPTFRNLNMGNGRQQRKKYLNGS